MSVELRCPVSIVYMRAVHVTLGDCSLDMMVVLSLFTWSSCLEFKAAGVRVWFWIIF